MLSCLFRGSTCPFFEIALTRCPRIDTHASTCQEVQHGLPSQSGAHPPRVPLSSFLRFVILVAQERCSVLNDFRLAVNRSEAAGWVDEGQGNGESRSHSLHSTVKTRPRPTSSTFWLTPQTNTTSPYCLGDYSELSVAVERVRVEHTANTAAPMTAISPGRLILLTPLSLQEMAISLFSSKPGDDALHWQLHCIVQGASMPDVFEVGRKSSTSASGRPYIPELRLEAHHVHDGVSLAAHK